MQILTRAARADTKVKTMWEAMQYVLACFLFGWGLGHRAHWRLHMSASLFPGSCSILLGLVSMATGSQQAARQLEGSKQASRQGEKAWAARGKLKLWGLGNLLGSWRGP